MKKLYVLYRLLPGFIFCLMVFWPFAANIFSAIPSCWTIGRCMKSRLVWIGISAGIMRLITMIRLPAAKAGVQIYQIAAEAEN